MIKRFSSLYAGHVDFEESGQNADPVNDRRYPNEHLATVFDKSEALARCMDDLGYHTLWFAEHHFQHEGYEVIPNIPSGWLVFFPAGILRLPSETACFMVLLSCQTIVLCRYKKDV